MIAGPAPEPPEPACRFPHVRQKDCTVAGCRNDTSVPTEHTDCGRRRAALLLLGAPALLAACRYPRDPGDTLGAVIARGEMTVAAAEHPPWVSFDGPSGVEVELIGRFARELGVGVTWRPMPASLALAAVESGEADGAAGGFTEEEVNADGSAAPSLVYHEEAILVAGPPGKDLVETLDGARVFVPPDVVAEGPIRRRGGIPVDEAEEADLTALPHWQVAARGLAPTGIVLARRRHVIAVPKGENAWLMGLEAILRESKADVDRLLREAAG